MDNKLLNKAITISGKEEKLQGGKPVIKLKDEKGLTYTVYKTKQDGSTSVAWDQLQELSVGDTVQIGFVEQQGEYEGKAVTYRTIRSFNKDIGEGVKNHQSHNPAPQAQSSSTGHSGASSEASDDYWDKKAYKQCLWAYWVKQDTDASITPEDMDLVWETFKKIEKDAEKRFAKGWAKAEAIYGELPTINQDDDPAGDFNPMVNDKPPEDFGEGIEY